MKRQKKYLKKQNYPLITLFVIWCTAIYIVQLTPYESFWSEIQKRFAELSAKDSILIAIVPLLNLLLTGLIPSQTKAKLIFWKLNYFMPGHRVFSELAPNDVRIDMDALKEKIGIIPTLPEEQNTLWYKYYRKYEFALRVENSHRNYLLTRDLSVIALLFLIVGTVGLIIAKIHLKIVFIYITVMFFHYILLAKVARNHGNGFACNVIVELLAAD